MKFSSPFFRFHFHPLLFFIFIFIPFFFIFIFIPFPFFISVIFYIFSCPSTSNIPLEIFYPLQHLSRKSQKHTLDGASEIITARHAQMRVVMGDWRRVVAEIGLKGCQVIWILTFPRFWSRIQHRKFLENRSSSSYEFSTIAIKRNKSYECKFTVQLRFEEHNKKRIQV